MNDDNPLSSSGNPLTKDLNSSVNKIVTQDDLELASDNRSTGESDATSSILTCNDQNDSDSEFMDAREILEKSRCDSEPSNLSLLNDVIQECNKAEHEKIMIIENSDKGSLDKKKINEIHNGKLKSKESAQKHPEIIEKENVEYFQESILKNNEDPGNTVVLEIDKNFQLDMEKEGFKLGWDLSLTTVVNKEGFQINPSEETKESNELNQNKQAKLQKKLESNQTHSKASPDVIPVPAEFDSYSDHKIGVEEYEVPAQCDSLMEPVTMKMASNECNVESEIYRSSELLEEGASSADHQPTIAKPGRTEVTLNKTAGLPQSKIPRKTTAQSRSIVKKKSNTGLNATLEKASAFAQINEPMSRSSTSPKPIVENKAVLQSYLSFKNKLKKTNEKTNLDEARSVDEGDDAVESCKKSAQNSAIEQRLLLLTKRYETMLKRYKARVKGYETAHKEVLEAKGQLKTIRNQMSTSGDGPDSLILPELPETITDNSGETSEAVHKEVLNKKVAILKRLERENEALKESLKFKENEIEEEKVLSNTLIQKIETYDEESKLYGKSFEERKTEEINKLTKTYTTKLAELKESFDEKCEELIELGEQKKDEIFQLNFKLKKESEERKKIQEDLYQSAQEIDGLNNNIEIFKSEMENLKCAIENQTPKIEKYEKELKQALQNIENVEEKNSLISQLLEEEKKSSLSLKDTITEMDKENQENKDRMKELSNLMIEKGKLIENNIKLLTTEQAQKEKIVEILCNLCNDMVDNDTMGLLRNLSPNNEQAVYKIKTEIENSILNKKNQDLSQTDAFIFSLQSDLKEKQKLLENLLEIANVKNADTCDKLDSQEYLLEYSKLEELNVENEIKANIFEQSDQNLEEIKPMVTFMKETSTTYSNYSSSSSTEKLMDMLETRRHAIEKMEKQIKRMEDLHSYCDMRRTLQESKIAELEFMLSFPQAILPE